MCGGSSPKAPTPPPRAPEAAQMPVAPSRRHRNVSPRTPGGVGQGTLLTSPRGVTTPLTQQPSLLGS